MIAAPETDPDPARARDRTRLDERVAALGLAASRARAADLIRRGFVLVDGAACLKPGAAVAPGRAVTLAPGAPLYVSRGGEKLAAALAAFGFDPAGRTCLDVGASTGGFTQVLLESGARCVVAVDVGTAQLDARLRADPRVVVREGLDARGLSAADLPAPAGAITLDVSFISLAKVLPVPMALAAPGAWLVALVKPQFEVGPSGVGKGGIVRDAGLRAKALADVVAFLSAQPDWRVVGDIASPISGGDGNVEYLVGAVRA